MSHLNARRQALSVKRVDQIRLLPSSSLLDWATYEAVEREPDRVSGTWIFQGTRVPVAALFKTLEDGVPVDEFPKLLPGVSLEQSRAVLERAARSALLPA